MLTTRKQGKSSQDNYDKIKNAFLYKKLKRARFSPKLAAEVGVWLPQSSNIYNFINEGVKSILVEPDKLAVKNIEEFIKNKKNVTLHKIAICDFNGEVDLFKRESSSFIRGLKSSPAIINDQTNLEETDKYKVKASTFNKIDPGSIDLLSIDIEGAEWYVLKNMVSRPKVISIETHGGAYLNPYLPEIKKWMKNNNYTIWYKDKSDSVFVLNGVIRKAILDKAMLLSMNTYLFLKRLKKRVKHRLRNLYK